MLRMGVNLYSPCLAGNYGCAFNFQGRVFYIATLNTMSVAFLQKSAAYAWKA